MLEKVALAAAIVFVQRKFKVGFVAGVGFSVLLTFVWRNGHDLLGWALVVAAAAAMEWEWVRALAVKARDAAFGSRPASKVSAGISPNIPMRNATGNPIESTIEVSPTPPNKNIERQSFFTAVSAFGRGAGNVIGFALKHPVLLIGLALVAFWLIAGSSCARLPFGKSADTLRAERDIAQANEAVAKHERDLSNYAAERAGRTHQDRTRVSEIVSRAEQELGHAVEQDDFDALWSAYDRAYRGVWASGPNEDSADPGSRGTERLHSPRADAA